LFQIAFTVVILEEKFQAFCLDFGPGKLDPFSGKLGWLGKIISRDRSRKEEPDEE
jgi:hypothetical protein